MNRGKVERILPHAGRAPSGANTQPWHVAVVSGSAKRAIETRIEEGLATCPQAAMAEYPGIVKQELGLDEHPVLQCGIALGYEDVDAPINGYRTPRMELEEFVTFHTE